MSSASSVSAGAGTADKLIELLVATLCACGDVLGRYLGSVSACQHSPYEPAADDCNLEALLRLSWLILVRFAAYTEILEFFSLSVLTL